MKITIVTIIVIILIVIVIYNNKEDFNRELETYLPTHQNNMLDDYYDPYVVDYNHNDPTKIADQKNIPNYNDLYSPK